MNMRAFMLLVYNPETAEASRPAAVLVADPTRLTISTIWGEQWDSWFDRVEAANKAGVTVDNVDSWLEDVTNPVAAAASEIDQHELDSALTPYEQASELVERWALSGR